MEKASRVVGSHQLILYRFMSKYLSKAATKRLPLTTKRAGKGYYKGKGGTKEGKLNSKGRFIVDPKKRLQLIVPDLEGFKVSLRNIQSTVFGDSQSRCVSLKITFFSSQT